jgi:hypothetical protein
MTKRLCLAAGINWDDDDWASPDRIGVQVARPDRRQRRYLRRG